MADDIAELIRQRAYAIWEREGRPEGREHEHWIKAVEEIRGETGIEETAEPVGNVPETAMSAIGEREDTPPEELAGEDAAAVNLSAAAEGMRETAGETTPAKGGRAGRSRRKDATAGE